MSNPMLTEKCQSSSKSSRRELKIKERKMWKKPIKISRLPSFGFSGSDFTVDQIPIIFSGYTAESEDSSSSSDMSDDSRSYSKSSDENEEEIDQERLRRQANLKKLKSMKVLRRQSTRKLGGGQRLMKMRSMKRLTSNSRHFLKKKKNLDLGLLDSPHYLRPTSSSASKNVEKIQKDLQVARLKRISSLRYNGLLKATCSSAMKGSSPSSEKSNDVCTYKYCSLHGRPHSHGADSSVVVPSLKRFVSMRRKLLKRQKSVNRRLVLLKRTLSRKRGPLGGRGVTDQESKQVDDNDEDGESSFEEESCGNDSESNGRCRETVMVDVDGGMDSMETVACKLEVMDDSDGRVDKDLQVDEESDQEVFEEEVSSLETCGNDLGSNGRSTEIVMVDVEDETVNDSTPEIMDGSDGRIDKDLMESVTDLDHDDGKVDGTKIEEAEEGCIEEDDGKNTENVWNDTVTLVKQAFDEILAELTDDDDSSDDISVTKDVALVTKEDELSDSSSSDLQPIEERDTHLSVIISTSDHRRGAKKWSYLKRVILLKRFLKSLERKERRKKSDGEANETIMRLRRELVGERKNAEEWMLDHALRQVISTLAPSQKRKVKHLVKAFESLIPMDRGHDDDLESPGREEDETKNSQKVLRDDKDATDLLEVLPEKDLEDTKLTGEASSSLESKEDSSRHLGSPAREEDETVNSQTVLRDDKDTDDLLEVLPGKDLEDTKLISEALESKEDSSHHLAVEEEVDGSEQEKTGDSEKQNLSTWRNLIQKHMVTRDKCDETEQEDKWSYGNDQMPGVEKDGDAAAVKSFQEAFEKILSEIPDPSLDGEERVSESSNSVKEKKDNQEETKRSWNSLRKVTLLKSFVKSLEKVRVFNPRKPRNLPVESGFEAENVLLRHRSTMEWRRIEGEELMLDYALRQAISRLAPIQRKKVELLVQAFDTVLDGHETPRQSKTGDTPRNNDETGEEGTPRVEVNKDEQRIKSVFSRFQVHQKDLKGEEEEVDSTPKESRSLPPSIRNVKQRIVVEKGKDSRMWKLIYKHMVTEKEGTDSADSESVASLEGECDVDARSSSNTVTLVREALEKILSEIPDNSSDDQSMDSDITTDQDPISFKPKSNEKRVKGWNNVKKVILLKRFVSDLGSLTRLSPKTPRVLPWEPDPETEKIRLRHQEIGGKRNSEEWMLDYALRQAISTLAPSQKRKVTLLAQAFDTISLQDTGSCSNPGSAASSRNISRQSSISSTTVHSGIEGNAEILRGRLRNLQENLKESTKLDIVANDVEEKQQCSGLWRLLCKQMEDNERNQTLPEEAEEEEEAKEDANVDGEKMELYQTEAVELLGEVIDGISLEEQSLVQGEARKKIETSPVSRVRSNRWSNLKRVILLRRFVKALENVRKFNPKEPRFLPLDPGVEAEKVNLRHQEMQNKRNGDEWMVDNALQEVVSKLTPARKVKVQLLVQAFESLSASGN